jgi:hypothetical protein
MAAPQQRAGKRPAEPGGQAPASRRRTGDGGGGGSSSSDASVSSAHDGGAPPRPPQMFAGLLIAGAGLMGAPRLGEIVRQRGGTFVEVEPGMAPLKLAPELMACGFRFCVL